MEPQKDNNINTECFSCFSKEELSFYDKKIKEAELKIKNNSLDINYYTNIEKNMIKYIDEQIPKNDIKLHKRKMFLYLREKFLSTRYDKRKHLLTNLQREFYSFLNDVNSLQDLIDIKQLDIPIYSPTSPESNNYKQYSTFLKNLQEAAWIRCQRIILDRLEDLLNIQKLPYFILLNERKILKYRVQRILMDNLKIPFDQAKIMELPLYKRVNDMVSKFSKGEFNLFDSSILTRQDREICYDILLYANISYLQYEDNKSIFKGNLKKYIYSLGLYEEYETKANEFDNVISNIDTLNKRVNEGIEKVLTFNKDKGEMGNNIYYLIFSFSALLNNLTEYNETKQNNITTYISSFSRTPLTSSRERQFLLNIINTIDNYIYTIYGYRNLCFKTNSILENYLFSNAIKPYVKALYNDITQTKISLDYNQIYLLLKKSSLDFNPSNDFSSQTPLLFINSLPISQVQILSTRLRKFLVQMPLSKDDQFELNQDDDSSFSFARVKTGLKSFKHNLLSSDQVNSLQLKQLKLIPLNPFNSTPHICLCIYGSFQLPLCNIYNTLSNDKRNVEFYIYNWQNEDNFYKTGITKNIFSVVSNKFASLFSSESNKTYDQINEDNTTKMVKNNKYIAKFYGKLLAFIIASRCVFNVQSISLLGISLGCNVVKNCLKELEMIGKEGVNVKEIVENVILVGGTMKVEENGKNREMFSVIGGKVVNCYSVTDRELKENIDIKAVGGRRFEEIKMEDKGKYFPVVENIELTNLKIEQKDYKSEMQNIINEIKWL